MTINKTCMNCKHSCANGELKPICPHKPDCVTNNNKNWELYKPEEFIFEKVENMKGVKLD